MFPRNTPCVCVGGTAAGGPARFRCGAASQPRVIRDRWDGGKDRRQLLRYRALDGAGLPVGRGVAMVSTAGRMRPAAARATKQLVAMRSVSWAQGVGIPLGKGAGLPSRGRGQDQTIGTIGLSNTDISVPLLISRHLKIFTFTVARCAQVCQRWSSLLCNRRLGT